MHVSVGELHTHARVHTHTHRHFALLSTLTFWSPCISTCPPGWRTFSQGALHGIFFVCLKQHYLKIDHDDLCRAGRRKKGAKGETQTSRQTDTLRETAPTQALGCAAHQAGIQLFTSADLLSIAIGCLPRRMR